MSISEAFDEVVAGCDEPSAIGNMLGALGVTVTDGEYGLVSAELKAIVGSLLHYNKKTEISADARRELLTGLGRVMMGKPAEGIADAVLDADISGNLDLI